MIGMVSFRGVMQRTLPETVSKCLWIQEIELGVDNCAMAIGKPRMSGTLAGKPGVDCRERTDAARNGSTYP